MKTVEDADIYMYFTIEADKEHHNLNGTRMQEEEGSTSQSKKSKAGIKCPVCGEIYSTRHQYQHKQTKL